MSKPRLVLIDWVDSLGCSSQWQKIEHVNADPLLCRSVGWLIHDSKNSKVVVPHISNPDSDNAPPQGCGDMAIPTRCIIRITPLREPNHKS
jgi:hypothetical protein